MPKLAHSLPPRRLILAWATGAMAVWGCTQSEPRSESGEGAEAPNGPASAEKESATQATAKVERTASAKSAPDQAKIAELCERSCAAAVPLNCLSKTACERQCQEAFAVPVCHEEFFEVLQCAAGQPTENWSCTSGTAPTMKDGVCDSEQRAAMSCLESGRPL